MRATVPVTTAPTSTSAIGSPLRTATSRPGVWHCPFCGVNTQRTSPILSRVVLALLRQAPWVPRRYLFRPPPVDDQDARTADQTSRSAPYRVAGEPPSGPGRPAVPGPDRERPGRGGPGRGRRAR